MFAPSKIDPDAIQLRDGETSWQRPVVIALLAIGIPVLVAISFAWFRAAADRNNRRSMRRYGSALNRLGDVARRSDAVAPVRAPSPEAIARPHVGPEPPPPPWIEPETTILQPIVRIPATEGSSVPIFDDVTHSAEDSSRPGTEAAAALARMVARSRSAHELAAGLVPPRHPEESESVRLRRLGPQTLQFSDLDAVTDDDESDLTGGETLPRLGPRRGRLPVVLPPRQREIRRRLVVLGVGVAVVLAGAAIAIGLQGGGTPSGSSTSTTTGSGSNGHVATTTITPTVLRPTKVSSALVVYDVPTTSYVVRFSATAPCWLGSQRVASGHYLWMDTLSAGQSTTYSARGTRIIRLGAPKAVSLTVNGIPVALPADNVFSYMLELKVTATK